MPSDVFIPVGRAVDATPSMRRPAPRGARGVLRLPDGLLSKRSARPSRGKETQTNCSTELTGFRVRASCTGVSVIASDVQISLHQLLSDGALLFWMVPSPGVGALHHAGGGRGHQDARHLTDLQLVALSTMSMCTSSGGTSVPDRLLIRIPKDGAAPSMVCEAGAYVYSRSRRWTPRRTGWKCQAGVPSFTNFITALLVKSAPLQGGPRLRHSPQFPSEYRSESSRP